jgi:hypothetical protein
LVTCKEREVKARLSEEELGRGPVRLERARLSNTAAVHSPLGVPDAVAWAPAWVEGRLFNFSLDQTTHILKADFLAGTLLMTMDYMLGLDVGYTCSPEAL